MYSHPAETGLEATGTGSVLPLRALSRPSQRHINFRSPGCQFATPPAKARLITPDFLPQVVLPISCRPKSVRHLQQQHTTGRTLTTATMSQRGTLASTLRLRYLLFPPVLLAAATLTLLFVHTDYNLVALYSQCRAYSRLPFLSRTPLVGPPACYIVSFFQTAVASSRAAIIMASALSFVAALLTVYVIEGARVCNRPAPLIAYPTGPLLVFTLAGGAFVWELAIAPAFLRREREILLASGGAREVGSEVVASPLHPTLGKGLRRFESDAEAVAIPVGVLLGFIVPSVLMVVLGSPVTVAVWLFSPIYVASIRWLVRAVLPRLKAGSIDPNAAEAADLRAIHLESHRASLALVYAAPVFCSVLSHAFLIWHLLARKDDRITMTRATLKFIEINVIFTGLTVLYWLLVEVGWRVVAVMVGVSLVLGPGAGVCAGWVYREGRWHEAFVKGPRGSRRSSVGGGAEAGPREGGRVDEQTPLLA
ncbi:hypothetical protein VUR80DRAFT_10340 [Thermomyces stellatus]